MPTRSRNRYLVTPSGFDDIGAVLDEMGEGFLHKEIDWDELKNPETLGGCEVLFINCAGESGDDDYAREIAPGIRGFVQNGGTIYCSCWAVAVVEAAFPGKCCHSGSYSGTVKAKVTEAGLLEFLGQSSLKITLCGWWPTRTHSRFDGQVFLRGSIDVDEFIDDDDADEIERSLGGSDDYPLLFSFRAGRGHVIYTAFHNEEQTSEDEKKLLRYLVLRPVLAQTAGSVADMAKAACCVPGKEILATIDRGRRSAPYVYQSPGSEGLMYVLAWMEGGQMRMVITNPAGKVCADVRGASPLRFETDASAGQWSCVVEGTSVAHNNFPYVLTLATRRGARPKVSGGVPAGPTGVQVTGNRQPLLWPCYLLIDCSSSASGVAPAIGAGLSSFLRGIKQIQARDVTPVVSVVPCRDGRPQIGAPQRIDQLGALNLACQGRFNLGPSLEELSQLLAQPAAKNGSKAFVVVVIGSSPEGVIRREAAGLRQIAAQGRANIVAVGLGDAVSDQTLCAVGTIPLRIRDASPTNCVEGFGWLVQVAMAMVGALSQSTGATVNLPPLPKGMHWLR